MVWKARLATFRQQADSLVKVMLGRLAKSLYIARRRQAYRTKPMPIPSRGEHAQQGRNSKMS
jgi:hypothetical protein